ncbi:MAG: DUF2017 domain-containing protein [Carbonactinosporaceae bacterium]
MVARFRRNRHGAVSVAFHAPEAALLRSLLEQTLEVLGEGEPGGGDALERALGTGGARDRPTDPVLARLLPDAYSDDDEAAAEFRRFTEGDLREAKRSAAATALATLERAESKITLDGAEAQAWLGALNDVRLSLGIRLDIGEDFEADLAGMSRLDPRRSGYGIYAWLGWLQETLVRALW